jgi:hypothetical protein
LRAQRDDARFCLKIVFLFYVGEARDFVKSDTAIQRLETRRLSVPIIWGINGRVLLVLKINDVVFGFLMNFASA